LQPSSGLLRTLIEIDLPSKKDSSSMKKPALILATILIIATPLPAQVAPTLGAAVELYDAKRFDEASRVFEQLARQKQSEAVALQYLGRIALQRNNPEAAVGRLERSIAIDSSNAESHYWLAQAYGRQAMGAGKLQQVGLARKAKAAFESAVRHDPRHVNARFGLMEFYLIAPGIMGGSVEKAKHEAREIRRIDPLAGTRAAARIHLYEKNYDAAEKEYLEAQRLHPENRDLRFGLGLFYVQRENYPRALAVFDEMLGRNANDAGAIYQIGRVAAVSGQNLDRGAEFLKRYLQTTPQGEDPPHSAAWFRLGQVHQKSGRAADARVAFRKTLELDPNHKGATEALKTLR
jgi:tetratricopeptide (TPR) repeat protein